MSRVLVTGAAGFIGSHTTDLLLAEGHDVWGLDNFRTGHPANLDTARQQPRFQFVEADCAEPSVADEVFRAHRPDAVIHLAAMVSVPESIAHPAENDRLNFQATRLIAEAAKAHGVKRIVFASSAAVYGANPNLPLRETAECVPLSPYGTAKLNSEKLLLELARAEGVTARCHRYFNVFGPRQDPSSPYSGVISLFQKRLRARQAPTIHGDGNQTRDFIHVADVARANALAATAPGIPSGVANICTGHAVSLNELYAHLSRVFGENIAPTHGPARAGDIRHSLGSPDKAKRELGFVAAIPFEAGLRTLASIQ